MYQTALFTASTVLKVRYHIPDHPSKANIASIAHTTFRTQQLRKCFSIYREREQH